MKSSCDHSSVVGFSGCSDSPSLTVSLIIKFVAEQVTQGDVYPSICSSFEAFSLSILAITSNSFVLSNLSKFQIFSSSTSLSFEPDLSFLFT